MGSMCFCSKSKNNYSFERINKLNGHKNFDRSDTLILTIPQSKIYQHYVLSYNSEYQSWDVSLFKNPDVVIQNTLNILGRQ